MSKIVYSHLPETRSKRTINYSDEEISLMCKKFGLLTPAQIAIEVNATFHKGEKIRGAAGISAKLRSLGLAGTAFTQRQEYSPDEDILLVSIHNEVGPSKCFEKYNKAIAARNAESGTSYPRRSKGGIAYRIRYLQGKKAELEGETA